MEKRNKLARETAPIQGKTKSSADLAKGSSALIRVTALTPLLRGGLALGQIR